MNLPFKWLTYDDVHRRVRNFGSGLINLGISSGTKMAIYSENRPEWVICEQVRIKIFELFAYF
jgi:long-subunit acyl-CoA synthetase (AMP-forming)